ncbi:hypothetical protein [Hafnia paralvei]|uniref:hypothetical protein n=1 Tax=Hafnia paralvei TaxID=546367 RepID=UPI000EE01E6A|nr:hypothetical protein [Hafnia paralvei]ELR4878457.1 hypothetical protein [Escherichia coli]TBM32591.1 hypothetical protein EYY85_00850 [Hafnia paralvei]HCU16944.1 hypothetical protein [Hafnia paralvei]
MKFSNGAKTVFMVLGIGVVCIIGALNWTINGGNKGSGTNTIPLSKSKSFTCEGKADVVSKDRLVEMLNQSPVGICVSRVNDDTFVAREMAVIQR